MDQYYGAWVPYSGTDAILLGVVLLLIAGVFIFLAFKLKKSLTVKMPGKAVSAVLVAVWILSILTFSVNAGVYVILLVQANGTRTAPENPITIFTLSFASLSFLIIFIANKGTRAALLSGALAAMAGPMIFEFPFDLMVITRTYPPIPPDPTALRALYFLPLFLIELNTLSLLFFSPLFKLTKYTLYSLAGMFLIFAIWGFLSLSFPFTIEFIVLNVAAKAMAFVTVVTLFLPEKNLAASTVS